MFGSSWPSYNQTSLPLAFWMTLGARSLYLAGRWLANMSGGSTTWSSTDTRIMSSVRMEVPLGCGERPTLPPTSDTRVSSGDHRHVGGWGDVRRHDRPRPTSGGAVPPGHGRPHPVAHPAPR